MNGVLRDHQTARQTPGCNAQTRRGSSGAPRRSRAPNRLSRPKRVARSKSDQLRIAASILSAETSSEHLFDLRIETRRDLRRPGMAALTRLGTHTTWTHTWTGPPATRRGPLKQVMSGLELLERNRIASFKMCGLLRN
jgi:hypothetical protein